MFLISLKFGKFKMSEYSMPRTSPVEPSSYFYNSPRSCVSQLALLTSYEVKFAASIARAFKSSILEFRFVEINILRAEI